MKRFFSILSVFLLMISFTSCVSQDAQYDSASKDLPDLWILGIGINSYKNFPVQITNNGAAERYVNLKNPIKCIFHPK